jgi:ribonuclease P protein component
MITRTHRFHGHGSLKYVYSRGQIVRGPFCVLKYTTNPRRKTWRMAIVVSRKVHKSAVTRNRIRRRMYEIVRNAMPADTDPIDLVFIVHAEQVATMPAADLERAIVSQLSKAGIVINKEK